jgi:6-phosphogluconolactonase
MRRIQVLSGLLLFVTMGCKDFWVPQTPSGGGGGNTGDYIYVGNGNNRFMAGFAVSSSGSLSTPNGSPYNNGVAVICSAIVPANTFLYAGTSSGIFIYLINPDGSMTVQNGGKIAAQDVVPTVMQVDSTGAYLLAAGVSTSTATQAIAIYQINATTGLLTAVTGSPLALYTGKASTPTVFTPTGMTITPNNTFVYVSLASLGVQILTLGANGALSAGSAPSILAPFPTSSSPADYGLTSDPGSKFLFVSEFNTGLRVFSIGTNGALSEVSGSPYVTGTGPSGVIMDSTGAYVYVANKGSNNISGFTLNATSGALTAISGSPFVSGGQLPIAFATDNSKQFLAVINSGSNGSNGNSDLQLFKQNATNGGKLVPVSAANTGTDPTNPQSIAATH